MSEPVEIEVDRYDDIEDDDLTEEEIEYDYLQRMEEEQDEEDEYLSRH